MKSVKNDYNNALLVMDDSTLSAFPSMVYNIREDESCVLQQ